MQSDKPFQATEPQVAVLIPCHNEELTVAASVREFALELPAARLYVYDNNSSDNTVAEARAAGAIVGYEAQQGKGNVLRRMFREIDADIYVVIDGDATYPAQYAREMIALVQSGQADMVVGSRLGDHHQDAFRSLHKFGNRLISGVISNLFSCTLTDVLSGYRVFSRRFVDHVPLISQGFEIETEMTLNALEANMVIREVPISYRSRPEGSESKLSTFKDGALILITIVDIFRNYRPLPFFFGVALAIFLLGILVGMPVIYEYFTTGLVKKLPSAVLAASLEVLAFQLFSVGLVLDGIVYRRRQDKDLNLRVACKSTKAFRPGGG